MSGGRHSRVTSSSESPDASMNNSMLMRLFYGVMTLGLWGCSERPDAWNVPTNNQPDYCKWNSIQKGMDVQEVLKILGQPEYPYVEIKNDPESHEVKGQTLAFGRIVYGSEEVPMPYLFNVTIYNGKVGAKYNPFGIQGDLPIQDIPTVPIIVQPFEGMQLGSRLNIVDVRWLPSCNKQPIKYEVNFEVDVGQWTSDDLPPDMRENMGKSYLNTKILHAQYSCGNASWGRVRVRAIGSHGTSPWSDYVVYRIGNPGPRPKELR
jgi:hypothetical protein